MIEETINQRIVYLILQTGLDKTKFANKVGLNAQTLLNVIKGVNKPGYETLLAIIHGIPNLNIRWLMLGEGSINDSDNKKVEIKFNNIAYQPRCEKCEELEARISELRQLNKYLNDEIKKKK